MFIPRSARILEIISAHDAIATEYKKS